MNDESKSPDTGQMDESFNEDFDFGEGETQSHPIKTATSKGRTIKIVAAIAVVAIVFIMGYRIYSPALSATKAKQSMPVASVNPIQPPKQTNETPEEIKKQSDEFAAALSGITPPTVTVPAAAPIPAPATPQPTITPVPTPPAPPISELIEPHAAEVAKDMPLEAAEATKLHEGLNKLNNQIDSILSQVKYLDAYSREVSDNLNKLNEAISTMDTRLLTLTNTTSTLSKDVGTVKNEVGQVREVLREDGLDIDPAAFSRGKQGRAVKEAQVAIAEPEYTVHAVVPGRAWLKSSKGQIVTVAEGDSIGNYGKILVIDAANGVVLTSSGVAFR